jgi:hypothetical protein
MVFFTNSSILLNIPDSLSSFLFTKIFQFLGFFSVQFGNVSQVLGSYILQSNLSFAFSTDNSNNTTL